MAKFWQNPIQRAANWLVSKAAPANQAWAADPSLWMQQGMDIAGPGRRATSSPVESAISLIAGDISTLRIKLMQRNADGTVAEVVNSPITRVLRKPNHYMTKTDMIANVFRSVMLYGNAYIWVDRDNRGQPVAMYPVRNTTITPMVTPDGSIYYSVQLTELERGERRLTESMMVPASDIIHHRVLTTAHPLIGVSPLYALGQTAALNAAIAENMARFHQNNSRPGGVLSIPGGLKQEARERLRQEFSKAFNGDQAGRTMVLDFETKFEQMAYTAQESSVAELLRFTVEDVCRALRIPRHLMGLEAGAASGVEPSMRMYYNHCLRPLIEALENRFDDFFDLHGTDRYVEVIVDDLFRAETDKRIESAVKAVQGSVMTPNEARRLENLPPVEGGDTAFLQRQMVGIDLLQKMHISEMENANKEPASAAAPADSDSEDDVARAILRTIEGSSLTPDNHNDVAYLIKKELNNGQQYH
jgi:HK97 family phage portal protein